MKLFRITIVGLTLAAGTAQAQQVSIRSGDHPTFSRITIPVLDSQEWNARKTIQGVELSLPGFSRGFDTSDVFMRMEPSRIVAIETTKDTLLLKVDCDCIATAFRSGRLLVIDVADQGTVLAGPPLEGFDLPGPAQEQAVRPAVMTLPWIGGPSPFGDTTDTISPLTPPTTDSAVEDNLDERAKLLEEVQKSLAERIANAANIGLLESSYEQARPSPDKEQETQEMAAEQAIAKQFQTSSNNIRITSSLDIPQNKSTVDPYSRSTGMTCPDEHAFAVETWGDDTGFSQQIALARSALMNARDQLDPIAARRLAKIYVYFGFGAEALDALRLDPILLGENPEITAIASILEHGKTPHPNTLSSYMDCNSSVALWAMLSSEKIPAGVLIDSNAALRALNNLPQHLRQIIAPALSDRLLDYGNSAAAAAAMRSLDRLGAPLTHDGMMSQAALALDAGRPAQSYLEEVIETNGTQSPGALVKLVERKLANDEPLPLETATLVEAYVQELRGTKIGYKLQQTQVIALGQSIQFEEAFDALDALRPSLSPERVVELNQTLFDQLTLKADDLVFLEHTFDKSMPDLASIPVRTRLDLANRMMDLGFAAQVQKILATIDETPRQKQRQILAARAALALRQPFQAQAALIGIDELDAEILMAQAKEMTGEYREAAEIFSDINATSKAAEAAWLSDEWQDLTSTDTPGLGDVATLARTSPEESLTDLGPLGRANRALEESETVRGMLAELLRNPLVRIDPDS